MTNAHILAAVIGVLLSLSIILLVRKDHLSPLDAAKWFFVALGVLFLSLTPEFIDFIGAKLGIGYPPIILVILAIGAALIKILLMDIERRKLQTKVERLIQKVAIVENEMEKVKQSNLASSEKVRLITDNTKAKITN